MNITQLKNEIEKLVNNSPDGMVMLADKLTALAGGTPFSLLPKKSFRALLDIYDRVSDFEFSCTTDNHVKMHWEMNSSGINATIFKTQCIYKVAVTHIDTCNSTIILNTRIIEYNDTSEDDEQLDYCPEAINDRG